MSGLIDRLHRHSAGKARIADQCADVKILTFLVACDRHPKAGRDRRRGMAGTKGVVLGLVTPKKTRNSAFLFDRVKLIAATGQYLVGVGLMPNIPNQSILGSIKYVMHRNREFYGAEAGTCMPADTRTRIDNELSNFVGNLLEVLDL